MLTLGTLCGEPDFSLRPPLCTGPGPYARTVHAGGAIRPGCARMT